MKGPAAAIGLEVHVQLATRTKLFCACAAAPGGAPNTRVCPTCLGLPGALPSPSREALLLAVRAALALGCDLHGRSAFARKHYFYPDLPKGYQITQHAHPLAGRGLLRFRWEGGERSLEVLRLHVEEDAGKDLHDPSGASGVDFNRAGVPLAEVVTAPDLASPGEAHAALSALRAALVAAGVTTGRMEEGALRCDANVSLRDPVTGAPGTRVEVKNLNSLKFVEKALGHEIRRQEAARAQGRTVQAETRLFDPASGATRPLRAKEEAEEYRHLPEPDLPALHLDAALLEEARRGMGESPEARRRRYREDWGLSDYDAGVLTADGGCAAFFEAVAEASGDPKGAARWVMADVFREVNARGAGWSGLPFSPGGVGALLRGVSSGALTSPQARALFARVAAGQLSEGDALREAAGASPLRDLQELGAAVSRVLAGHPQAAGEARAGRVRVLGFLVGRVLQETGGRADPAVVRALLEERLRE